MLDRLNNKYYDQLVVPLLISILVLSLFFLNANFWLSIGDLEVNEFVWNFGNLESRPMINFLKYIFPVRYVFVYFVFYIFIYVSVYFLLKRLFVYPFKVFFLFLVMWFSPYGAPIFYTNILYQGISLFSMSLFFFVSKWKKVILISLACLVHPVAFFVNFLFFFMPGLLALKKKFWFFILYGLLLIFGWKVLSKTEYVNLIGFDLNESKDFIVTVRNDLITRIKLSVFFLVSLILIKRLILDLSFRLFNIGVLIFGMFVVCFFDIPFIERFVIGQVVVANLVIGLIVYRTINFFI